MGATSNLTQVKPKCNDVDNRQSENVDFPLASSLRVEKYYNPRNRGGICFSNDFKTISKQCLSFLSKDLQKVVVLTSDVIRHGHLFSYLNNRNSEDIDKI